MINAGRQLPVATGRQAALPASPGPGAPPRLAAMRISEIWTYLKGEKASFWLLNIYLFFEYVRPQQIYPQIDVIPYAQTALVLTVFFVLSEGVPLRRWHGADTLLLLFSAIVIGSIAWAEFPAPYWKQISVWISWVVIYFLITTIINTQERFIIFLLAFLAYSTKMSQHGFRTFLERGGSFADWGATGGPGWFHNSGEFGVQMCIFFPLALAFARSFQPYWSRKKYWAFMFMPLSAIISIVASSSRGSLIALVPQLLWMGLKGRNKLKGILLVLILGAATWYVVPQEQKDRLSSIGSDETSDSRKTYWKYGLDVISKHKLTGVGYQNWLPHVSSYYPPWQSPSSGWGIIQLPHNIFIEAGAELGYPGLLLFCSMIVMTLVINRRTRKAAAKLRNGRFSTAVAHGLDTALIGYVVAGFFVTVLYYPFFRINYAMSVALYSIVARSTATIPNTRRVPKSRQPLPAHDGP